MEEKRFRKNGWIAGGLAPLAWALLYLVGILYSAFGSVDAGMIWLVFPIVPMHWVGTAAAVWWLVRAFQKRRLFSKPPILLVFWNLLGLTAGLVMVLSMLLS